MVSREEPLSSVWLYEKLRPFVKLNDQANVSVLNATFYYARLEKEYSQQTLQSLERKEKAFKVFRLKLDEQMKPILQRREGQKECEEVRAALQKRYCIIQSKLKELRKSQSQAKSAGEFPSLAIMSKESSHRMDDEALHEQIEEQLLNITAHLKRYAKDINKNLEKDNQVIQNINDSQEKNTSLLDRSTKTMVSMMKNPQLGFFQLLFMAGISIVAFLVTSMFIIII